jgi:DNA-binding PadR family transcriptional regulator
VTEVATRSGVLELAVLGLLHDTPMHGYELRKRLNAILGWGRTLSYGSLYPCLKQMLAAGLITEDVLAASPTTPGALGDRMPATRAGRRGKIVYKLTPDGKEHFQQLLDDAGPASWEDETFGVHLAFFGQTDREVRMRILEGRRTRLEERRDGAKTAIQRARERLDEYTLELQRHGLESVEREVRWLTELIDTEHNRPAITVPKPPKPTGLSP